MVGTSEGRGSPFFTFIIPVPPDSGGLTGRLVDSVLEQEFAEWEIRVVSPSILVASKGHISDFEDERISSVVTSSKGGLAGAINDALVEARGRFVAILGANDAFPEGSLRVMANVLKDQPDIDVAYADEKRHGQLVEKPAFSPERLRSQNYLGDFIFYRGTLLASIGGVRTALDGAELYDLALRATVAARRVLHVPKMLFSSGSPDLEEQWNPDRQQALESTRRILAEHLVKTGGGRVEQVGATGLYRTHRSISGNPLVSIVIPTRGSRAPVRGVDRCLVVEAVRSVVEKTSYGNFELVIVIDDVAPPEVITQLRDIGGDRIRFVTWSRPFSFSEKMNLGVVHARGEYVLFLNDDIEVITTQWLEAMLALGQRPKAGLVGAMLYFEDETIQHAGHAYYKLDVTHIGLNSPRGAAGPSDGFRLEREVAGVTCACALMSRELFLEVGGFSPLLPGNFNDVDLCMKVAMRGYQSYWTPYAELYHFESKTRDPRVSRYEINLAWGRWEHLFYDSPLWPTDPHLLYPVVR